VPDGFIAKVLTGTVADTANDPIAGARVTVLETGDTASTDSNGQFEVEVNTASPDNLSVEVQTGVVAQTVSVPSESELGSRIDVAIQVNVQQRTVSTGKGLHVVAKIIGVCDFAFANNAVIHQGNALKRNTKCPVQVTVFLDNKPLSGIPFKIEHSRCAAEKWKPLETGKTGKDGVGTLIFTFNDTPEFCDYRIVAPDHYPGLKSIEFPVRTFRRQLFDKGDKGDR